MEVQEINKEYFFNLIIPYHNPSEEMVKKLFDSLIHQNINKDELLIIAVDDNSDNLNYREWIKEYDLNIFFTETNTNIHCPGNTRKKGMEFINGHWLFFCDQDDYFEENILPQIKDFIKENEKKDTVYVVSTIMRSFDPKKNEGTKDFKHQQAWLHGKWYSIDNLIRPYNIDFKQDLISHEDIYFNSLVLSKLFALDTDWHYFDIYTYRWVENPDSITRQQNFLSPDRGYLYDNFQDYLDAASEPFWEYTKEHPDNVIFVNQIMMTLMHAYFYYEAASYYMGPDKFDDIIKQIKNYIHRINDELNFDLNFIIDFLYVDAYKYSLVQKDCEISTGYFIPKTSLRDFVYKLGQ